MTTETPIDIGTLIVPDPDPDSIRGRPVLAGSRVTVHTIAARFSRGDTLEEILDSYPHLDLSRIYAALAYYFANKAQVDADLDEDEAWVEEQVRQARHADTEFHATRGRS